MIYLDNGATTYPKPSSVVKSAAEAMKKYGANAGRGAYKMALLTTEQIFLARKAAAEFFGAAECENVVFTYNCTASLNTAIKGLSSKGSHFVISDLEHNAVLRPLEKLKKDGVSDYSVAEVVSDEDKTVLNFRKEMRKNTVAIICTGASNVFGIMPPIKKLAELAHLYNVKFILDGAQIAGTAPVNMQTDGIDILCCAGHKGLYGPSGVGVLILGENVRLNTLIEGGTGSNSASPRQPDIMPDRFESGTPNVPGIIGLRHGVEFVKSIGAEKICSHETSLLKYIQKNIETLDNVILYTNFFDDTQKLAPILSFNIENRHSEETAEILSRSGICVRAGLHCAPLAHKKMGTEETGTVRICPSVFTKKEDIDFLIKSIRKIAK